MQIVKDWALMLMVAGLVLINVTVLAIWNIVDPVYVTEYNLTQEVRALELKTL